MKADDAKRLKELETKNARLKKLLAEAELDKGCRIRAADQISSTGAPTLREMIKALLNDKVVAPSMACCPVLIE